MWRNRLAVGLLLSQSYSFEDWVLEALAILLLTLLVLMSLRFAWLSCSSLLSFLLPVGPAAAAAAAAVGSFELALVAVPQPLPLRVMWASKIVAKKRRQIKRDGMAQKGRFHCLVSTVNSVVQNPQKKGKKTNPAATSSQSQKESKRD